MKKQQIFLAMVLLAFATGCSTSYKAKPLPFKTPTAYGNHVEAAGAVIGAEEYSDSAKAKAAFGFDVRRLAAPLRIVNRGRWTLGKPDSDG